MCMFKIWAFHSGRILVKFCLNTYWNCYENFASHLLLKIVNNNNNMHNNKKISFRRVYPMEALEANWIHENVEYNIQLLHVRSKSKRRKVAQVVRKK